MNKKTYLDPPDPIKAAIGDEFTIILKSNPTTGYSWRFAAPPDEKIITLVNSTFQPPQTQLKGAGGEQLWTFRAVGEGKTTISLEYVRPWEKGKPPIKTRNFSVSVDLLDGVTAIQDHGLDHVGPADDNGLQ
ncbi:MAG: protease inhibitor I42 family protein [Candidatus Euphemobacter frigidus]|nr:protease inhibitor I42 family protein [Candidatus Euphemobacter frigidus]MDP8275626.1 protease inhibitor I42 family protein [Candidatus Euphemobacter frigidus]